MIEPRGHRHTYQWYRDLSIENEIYWVKLTSREALNHSWVFHSLLILWIDIFRPERAGLDTARKGPQKRALTQKYFMSLYVKKKKNQNTTHTWLCCMLLNTLKKVHSTGHLPVKHLLTLPGRGGFLLCTSIIFWIISCIFRAIFLFNLIPTFIFKFYTGSFFPQHKCISRLSYLNNNDVSKA